VQISDEVMPGTVALPFGWGHAEADGLPHARERAGVNVNRLAPDGRDSIDPLSGMAFLSGIPVEVTARLMGASLAIGSLPSGACGALRGRHVRCDLRPRGP
jgi:hypothetical protein